MEPVTVHLWIAKALLDGVRDFEPSSDQPYEVSLEEEAAADEWLRNRIRSGIPVVTSPTLQRAL